MWHFLQCENYDLTTLKKEMPTILKTMTDEENDFEQKLEKLKLKEEFFGPVQRRFVTEYGRVR
jgi:hypothetical protein